MASVVWYWARNGVRTGPVPWESLRASAHKGEFGPGDWVWTPGFGREWKRASVLDALFPPEPATEGESSDAKAETSSPSASPESPAAVEDVPSPFADAALDGRPPETPRTARALANAWRNVLALLANPFSWRRYAAFAFAALLLLFGSQSIAPFGTFLPGVTRRLSDSGLDLTGGIPAFLSKWTAAISRGGVTAADQGTLVSEFAAALRHSATSFSAWMASTPRHLLTSLTLLLLAAAAAALHAWFLSRGWTVMLHRVYRRDEPVARSWIDARTPARTVFRGAFAMRFALVLCWTAAAWISAARLAAAPESAILAETLSRAVSPLAAMALLDAASMVFARDFAVPRVVLLGQPFASALRGALRESGFWTVRHLLLLSLVASLFVILSALVLQPFAALVPPFFPLVAAAFLAPYQMLRSLWALDIFFRLHPEARTNVPPRASVPPEIAAAFAGRRG